MDSTRMNRCRTSMKLQPKSSPAFARGSSICWDPRARLEKDIGGGSLVTSGRITSFGEYSIPFQCIIVCTIPLPFVSTCDVHTPNP